MDPRITRSRAALHEAVIALAGEQALDDITVADITTRAGVNRSTFYQHFSDKGELLADALEAAVDAATAPLKAMGPAEPTDPMPPALLTYLEHIRDHASLYRRVLGDHGSGVVASQLRGWLLKWCSASFRKGRSRFRQMSSVRPLAARPSAS